MNLIPDDLRAPLVANGRHSIETIVSTRRQW